MKRMTYAEAKLLWSYDRETGVVRWRDAPRIGMKAGDRAGVIGNWGYRIITFGGKKYKASRVAWLLVTGGWPRKNIDHINGDRSDDRWENLREATQSENLANMSVRSDNRLGVKGVSPTSDGRFLAGICFKGQRKNLGVFTTLAEAVAARKHAETAWHGEFARR